MLKDISKYLVRFREIFAQAKKNSYAYGRGETYSLELGNNLSRALTSELAMLATPETIPLFLRKYQQKQIKQYRRREPMSANRVSSELAQNEQLYNVEATNNVHVGGKRVRGFMGTIRCRIENENRTSKLLYTPYTLYGCF